MYLKTQQKQLFSCRRDLLDTGATETAAATASVIADTVRVRV